MSAEPQSPNVISHQQNLRLYYLDSSNRIVELASSCSTSAPCTWTRLTYFTAISTGGLSAVYMNDDGIRVYCIGSSGSLWVLVSYRGPWYAAALGMTARSASGLSATVIPSDSGPINGIYLLHVGPDGDLKEMTWERAKNYTSYLIGELDSPVISVSAYQTTSMALVRHRRGHCGGKKNPPSETPQRFISDTVPPTANVVYRPDSRSRLSHPPLASRIRPILQHRLRHSCTSIARLLSLDRHSVRALVPQCERHLVGALVQDGEHGCARRVWRLRCCCWLERHGCEGLLYGPRVFDVGWAYNWWCWQWMAKRVGYPLDARISVGLNCTDMRVVDYRKHIYWL